MAGESLANDVVRALAADTRIDHSMINVSGDAMGKIMLTGQVDTYNEKGLAEEIAERVRGVSDVVNSVVVVPPLSKTDDEITEGVRKNLELDVWVDHTRIDVETVDSVVFLRGTAGTMTEKLEAENDARWIAGVIDAVNHIAVKPEAKVEDAEITRDIRAALIKNTRLDLTEMNVDVTDGLATLTGEVGNFVQKRIAEFVTFAVPGVVDVVNQLHIRSKGRKAA